VQLDDEFRMRIEKRYWPGIFPPSMALSGLRRRNQRRSSIPWPDECPAGEQASPGRHRRASPGRHTPAPRALAFYDQGADSLRGELLQYAKQLRRQPQSKNNLRALAIDKRLPYFRRDQALFETAETRCQMAGHAVFFGEGEQARPIHGTKQASKPLTIERW